MKMNMNMNLFYSYIIFTILIFSKAIFGKDIHFFKQKDSKVSQSYVNPSLQESRIFEPIDIRKLCYNLQSESKVYETIYNLKANFYRYRTKSFSIRDANFRISRNKTATIAARSCQLIKDKTNREIYITSLSENLNDETCPTCIVMLSCESTVCTLDSVAIVENLHTEYTSDPIVFPVYNERKNLDGSKITDDVENPNGLKFKTHSEDMTDEMNQFYKTRSPLPDQTIFYIKNLRKLCSELQLASEFSEDFVYNFNPNFYTRDDNDFAITTVYFDANKQSHGIWARNCYLRNEKTNANIYLTGISQIHLKGEPNLPTVVVLECYSTACSANEVFSILKIKKRYKITTWKVTRTPKPNNLEYYINSGTKSDGEYLNDLELMYEKETLQSYYSELILENEVIESKNSISFPINMKLLCNEVQLKFPEEYTKTDDQFPGSNEAEQVFLRMPRKYESVKTISAKKCNLVKNSYLNGRIYLTTAPTNTLDWANTLVVLMCDLYNLCLIDTLLHVDDFWIYVFPQPDEPDETSNSSNMQSDNKKLDIEHLTQKYLLYGSFNEHRIFAELDIILLCSNLADNSLSENRPAEMPTLYSKIRNFGRLKNNKFENSFVLISDDKGHKNKIKARTCNLTTVNTDWLIYVTSPPITVINEPEWRNRITILMCGGNNALCMVVRTHIIDNFEEKFHISPII